MKLKAPDITVFEHQSLRLGEGKDKLSKDHLDALQKFYGEKGVPYYSLIHNGVKFNEHVGVIQIGKTQIEILPKADKTQDQSEQAKRNWQTVLIDMLKTVDLFKVHAPSSSNLSLKSKSVLDLYFELFIQEIEYLIHRGLIKKYRKIEGNRMALKGSLQFPKHVRLNAIHQERFYVNYSTYDTQHDLHAILFKALKLLSRINTNAQLSSRLGVLLLHFPEQAEIRITESIFDKIRLNRKTEPYKKALEIAKLILLNYHPDLSQGRNHVLALMFDMNLLWEKFVYASIRKFGDAYLTVSAQNKRGFWKPKTGQSSSIRPDIVINRGKENCIVLDTKWKNLDGSNPSVDDLRQMFVYNSYFGSQKVALVYPGTVSYYKPGNFYKIQDDRSNLLEKSECGIFSIAVNMDVRNWQIEISNWIKSNL